MIFARDKSQMCNNLLQYAHVYAWGREHGRKVISMRFSYKYQYFHICHTNLTSFGWYLTAKCLAALKLLPTANFKHRDCNCEELEQKMLRHRNIVVSGWFVRYYDLFLKYRKEICELFTLDEQYTEPVKAKMQQAEESSAVSHQPSTIRLGVHIRRGDYAEWRDGQFFFDDETYARHINRFAELNPGKTIHVYLSTNDSTVTEVRFQQLCPNASIHNLKGNAPEDLFMLSECDYLIGPPSTFSLVAQMYRDIPLYRMDTANEQQMTMESFRLFEYWFQNMV
jgi:hypothetical protein